MKKVPPVKVSETAFRSHKNSIEYLHFIRRILALSKKQANAPSGAIA